MNATVSYIRGDSKCRRKAHGKMCDRRQSEHVGGVCPGSGKTFVPQGHGESPRVSLSIGADEVELAHEILTGVASGRDLRMVARSKTFARLARTVLLTAQRAKAKRAEQATRKELWR